ncbi:2-oxo acid dehydrogenase subunit E2 [Streptomyces qinglanensis]|uniref:2-oxoacid dehydrogenases acyltransferase (Catalytic domain) n=1 Tax=Streptomyces qinglanensis TaxID=943816 RepID=A0A1H9RF79_9ACTN|nr:2-oxo acid dehydrogenase subunit E2 [Streptomyces qinglanensis]SER70633.1 2-oxoacid dehydrogenases acyltransferase (catalytic domain) [Streptomyces qinglanensis]
MRADPFPRERRHTAYFLRGIRACAPVFLGAEVDMTAVRQHQRTAGEQGGRPSTVAYVLYTAARVLAAHPEANAALRGGMRPRIAHFGTVAAKLALDKRMGGRRVVLSAVLPDLHLMSLRDIARNTARLRAGDPESMPEFAGVRVLHRLPGPLGRLAYRAGTRPLRRRLASTGTFSVTSLGHRPLTWFHSVGSTTVTLGLGAVADRPVVRGGTVTAAPVLPLSLTFDHRVIDGAEAADVLGAVKHALETFGRADAHGGGPAGG